MQPESRSRRAAAASAQQSGRPCRLRRSSSGSRNGARPRFRTHRTAPAERPGDDHGRSHHLVSARSRAGDEDRPAPKLVRRRIAGGDPKVSDAILDLGRPGGSRQGSRHLLLLGWRFAVAARCSVHTPRSLRQGTARVRGVTSGYPGTRPARPRVRDERSAIRRASAAATSRWDAILGSEKPLARRYSNRARADLPARRADLSRRDRSELDGAR